MTTKYSARLAEAKKYYHARKESLVEFPNISYKDFLEHLVMDLLERVEELERLCNALVAGVRRRRE